MSKREGVKRNPSFSGLNPWLKKGVVTDLGLSPKKKLGFDAFPEGKIKH